MQDSHTDRTLIFLLPLKEYHLAFEKPMLKLNADSILIIHCNADGSPQEGEPKTRIKLLYRFSSVGHKCLNGFNIILARRLFRTRQNKFHCSPPADGFANPEFAFYTSEHCRLRYAIRVTIHAALILRQL